MKKIWRNYIVHCVEEGFTSALRDKLDTREIVARTLDEAMRKALVLSDRSGTKHYVESAALMDTYYIFVKCPCCNLWIKTCATNRQT